LVEYNNPLEGRLKFVIDNLEVAHAVYENLGYIQGYMDGNKNRFERTVSSQWLREQEQEKCSRLLQGVKCKMPSADEQEREHNRIQDIIKSHLSEMAENDGTEEEPIAGICFTTEKERKYWEEREREKAESVEVKEEDGNK
jgi:hypothetical protein